MAQIDFPSLSGMHRATCDRLGPLPALRFKRDGLWRHITWDDYRRQADEVAAGLIELDVKPGDRIAILSENRWEWLVTDHAILSAGAVSVPIHAPSTPAQIQYQLEHSGACGIFVSTQAQWEKLASIYSNLRELRFVISFEPVDPSTSLVMQTFDSVRQSGHRAGVRGRREIASRESCVTADGLATIIYTSGTTSQPKGVMLSQANLLTNSFAGAEMYRRDKNYEFLNWLPFSHVFARTVDHYAMSRLGHTVVLAESATTALKDIEQIQPAFFTSVPRLLEKAWSILTPLTPDCRRKKAKQLFGDRLIHISSGGAPLPIQVATDLRDAGVIVLEGYGLTESSPIISFNIQDRWKVGTVGLPIPDAEVRVAADGEVLTRGPHVMLGYWHDPQATAEALRDGWLHTGDLGSVDSDGFLSITGRKKDLIVTSGGKKVVPAALEAMLIRDPCIDQALVYGDARPFVSAIIVPKFDALDTEIRRRLTELSKQNDVIDDEALLAWFQRRVDLALRDISAVERVKRIVVLNRALSIDLDELTVTQKVRRAAVFRRYQSQLDSLYLDRGVPS